MRKEQIETMIDKKIEKKFISGTDINLIKIDLSLMISNMTRVLKNDGYNIDDILKLDYDSIEKARVKYTSHYIKFCNKRIEDFNWIEKKRNILSDDYLKLWKLLKFKERILNSKEEVSLLSQLKKQFTNSMTLTQELIDGLKDEEKNWSNGDPKLVGQTSLRGFLRKDKNSTDFKMVYFPSTDIDKYELDLEQYERIKMDFDLLVIPYIKSKYF